MSYGDVVIKSNSNFLKIDSGIPHDVRLLSNAPREKTIHGFGKDANVCAGEGCLDCANPDPKIAVAKQRFNADIYDFTLKKKMTWEFGASVMKQLKAIDITLREEDRKITDVDLKVEATGSNMSKKYTVTPRMTSKALPVDMEIPF